MLLSLVLITVSFRSTALDGVQGTAAHVLRPFEVAADRVSRPFRDAVGWAHGLVDAKAENKKLRSQLQDARRQLILAESAVQENVELRAALNYHGPPSIASFDQVRASVLTHPQNAIDESVTIAAGTDDGVVDGSVVVSPSTGGLVGTVDRAFAHESHVTLLSDDRSAVTAKDLTFPTSVGVIKRGGGGSQVLILDLVPKAKYVARGDTIITAGTLAKGDLPSMFPAGIPIGTVTSQSSSDANAYKSIQVDPLVDFTSLQSVVVLVPKKR